MDGKINEGDVLLSKKSVSYINIVLYIFIFILLGLFTFFYFLAFVPIDGESMENTITDGHYCLVQRKCFDIERGDIVTINTATEGKEHIIIKRVIGVEHDKLIFMVSSDGQYVDLYMCTPDQNRFSAINEPYIKEKMKKSNWISKEYRLLPYTPFLTETDVNDENFTVNYPMIAAATIKIPENNIFFLGDNRNISRDSRYYGTRSIKYVQSKVLLSL